jgi:two-component system, LytTR family, sensor kinase
MKTVPIKSLVRASVIVPVFIALLVGLASSAKYNSLPEAMSKAGFTLALTLLIAFMNIGLFALLVSVMPYPSRKFTITRYICSYALTLLMDYVIFLIATAFGVDKILTPLVGEKLEPSVLLSRFLVHGVITNTFMLINHNYMILMQAKNAADLENARLRTANAEAINQLLRQQIHPHFLFNALSTLKSLIRRQPEKAEEYLIHLSDFLRATISKGQKDIISLRDELKLSMDYMEMQKMRVGNALRFSVRIQEPMPVNRWLPAFSLQPLLENAIKHNVLTEEEPLYLDIIQEGNHLKVTNNIQLKPIQEASTGSGLQNLSERHKLLCGEDIQIENNGYAFSVRIKILTHADSDHRG